MSTFLWRNFHQISKMKLQLRIGLELQQKTNPVLFSTRNNSLKMCHTSIMNRSLCTDATDVEEISVDKRIYKFLEQWDVNKAVSLATTSTTKKSSLSGHAVIHLLEKLGEIGDTENIISLEPYLKDTILISMENFYYYLAQSFYNSGQMEQGAEYLEAKIQEDLTEENLNIIFTLLTVPILNDFEVHFPLYLKIVNNRISEGDFYLVAVLWKCYILCGQFRKADELLVDYQTEIKSILPIMMNEICQLKDRVSTPVLHEEMLLHLIDTPQLRKKRLRILVYKTLLQILYTQSRWFDIQTTLMQAKDTEVELPSEVKQQYVDALKRVQNEDDLGLDLLLIKELESWANDTDSEH